MDSYDSEKRRILQRLLILAKCAFSRYRSCPYSRERASQNFRRKFASTWQPKSRLTLHRQVPGLQEELEVRSLAVPADDRTAFSDLATLVFDAVEAEHAATGREVDF